MNMKKMGLISAVGFTALMGASLATNALADDHKEGKGKHHKMEMRDPARMADRLAEHLELDDLDGLLVAQIDDPKILTLSINSGTLELNDNKAIILAD